MTAPKLLLQDIGKRYKIGPASEIEAIRGVSFEVM